jgi:hypothetical protein
MDQLIEMTTGDMLRCLDANPTSSFKECLSIMLENVQDDHDSVECRWQSFNAKFWETRRPYEMDPERVSIEAMAQLLLGPPPPLEIQLMLMGLPGMVGGAGLLCVQTRARWACAPNPFDGDPGVTTGASSGGGDR